jgi:glycerate 2-kinase
LVRPEDAPLRAPHRSGDVAALVDAALAAVSAAALVRAALSTPSPHDATADRDPAPWLLLSAGKAASAMAAAYVGAGPPVASGLVISTHGEAPSGLTFMAASHPVPDQRSVAAARAALRLAASCPADGRLIALISGGASALMALPVDGVTLQGKAAAVRRLLEAGADITALNAVRKHLSAIKGGRLAAACPGRLEAWLLSDVVGDDPSVIGSGPTVADPSTFADALEVIDRFGGRARYPADVVAYLEAGAAGRHAETPKSNAELPWTSTRVIGSASQARLAIAAAARQLGYDVIVRDEPVVGEARRAAVDHLAWIRARIVPARRATCVVSSGETTVHVTGDGRGGRNQEFALAAALELERTATDWTVASIGTDGVDGPTDAAGASVDGETTLAGRERGLDAERFLQANDAWTFFAAVGGLLRTGPTDTNVGDVQIVLTGAA